MTSFQNFILLTFYLSVVFCSDETITKSQIYNQNWAVVVGINEYKITDTTDSATIVLNITSHWGNFDRQSGRTTTDNSQQRFFSSDKGMEFSALNTKDIRWGRPD